MDLFGLFGEMFNPNKKKPKSDPTYMTLDEVVENYKRQRANNPRPKYWPGKGTYYGDKIYGMEPGDWKQTKPPATRKKIDLSKGKWKSQFTKADMVYYATDIRTIHCKVPGLFDIEVSEADYNEFQRSNYKKDFDGLDDFLIQKGIVPYPMEELV